VVIGFSATVLFAVTAGLAAVVQAHAVRRLPGSEAGVIAPALQALQSPLIHVVVTLYLLSWLLHVVAIDRLPLFLAQAGVAASLAVTALGAARWLREHLGPRHWAAIGVVVLGLGLLLAAAGPVTEHQFGPAETLALYGGIIALAVGGVGLALRPGGGLAIALLGGLAYAGSPLATRAMVDEHGWGWLVPAVAVAAYGVLGFWLYSLAMQRTSVAAASTVLVVVQVLVPAVAGMTLLGDGLDRQWGWLVVPGLLLAVVGGAVVEHRGSAPS
jgi:drug/metabolite transporter (DMT)-like permease